MQSRAYPSPPCHLLKISLKIESLLFFTGNHDSLQTEQPFNLTPGHTPPHRPFALIAS